MTEKNKRSLRTIVSIVVGMALLFIGCARQAESSPSAADVGMRSEAAGFLAAAVERSRGFIAGENQRERSSDCAYLYDNAVAVVALSHAGAQWHAERIADAIVFAQEHDRTFQDGRLRNAYISGDPRSDSGHSIIASRVTIRLPGFWQNGRWQEDYYTVSTSAGNMCAAAEKASDEKKAEYLAAAIRAADFILTLRSENGGFVAGYEGWDDAQIKATYSSTEHNLGIYSAFRALSDAVEQSVPQKATEYRDAAEEAKRFVLSMYDKKLGCFYTGTKEDGKTISDGVIPLDANSIAVLALAEALEDPYRILSFVEERMAVGAGFDFSAGDLDGIWNEGAAQMAVCYHMLNNTERYDEIMIYLKTQTGKDGSIPAADRDGVSTGFVIVGSDSPWEYYNLQSISATGWLALAQLGKNPLEHTSE